MNRFREGNAQELLATLANLRGMNAGDLMLCAHLDIWSIFSPKPVELLIADSTGGVVTTVGRIDLTLPDGGRNELATMLNDMVVVERNRARERYHALLSVALVVVA